MFARLAPLSLALAACAAAPPAPVAAQSGADRMAWTEACGEWDDWDKPAPPFRIHGNTYYVGTCGIAALLITGDEGHVLIDSGTEAGAKIVAANIEALGFRLADVKELLMSHEHFDHVGGMARLQELTSARLIASDRAAPVMRTGRADPDDPQAGMHEPFRAVTRVEELGGADGVLLGDTEVYAIATPGHTPGAMSWRWRSCEADRCVTIVYADSLSAVSRDDYRFSDHPAYVEQFRTGIAQLAAVPCDLLLTPHPSASGLRERLIKGDLTSSSACADYAANAEVRLDERLFEEAGPE